MTSAVIHSDEGPPGAPGLALFETRDNMEAMNT
jgi:hypothetical protein